MEDTIQKQMTKIDIKIYLLVHDKILTGLSSFLFILPWNRRRGFR